MSEQIQWNIYSEIEAEVVVLWQIVQNTLKSLEVPKREAIGKCGEKSNDPLFL